MEVYHTTGAEGSIQGIGEPPSYRGTGMFERNIIIKVLIGMVILLGIGLALQSYRVGSINKRYTALQVSTATLEASRDKLRGMYESANIKLTEARRTSANANKEYTDAVKNDPTATDWADTVIPSSLLNSLR